MEDVESKTDRRAVTTGNRQREMKRMNFIEKRVRGDFLHRYFATQLHLDRTKLG